MPAPRRPVTTPLLAVAVAILLGGTATATAPAASAAADPVVRSLSFSAATVDVTNGPASVTVRTRITSTTPITSGAVARSEFVPAVADLVFAAPGALRLHDGSATDAGSWDLRRVSGTGTDGVYESVIPVEPGVNGTTRISLSLGSDDGATGFTASPADLTAAGLPSSFVARTTKAPAQPTGLKGTTKTFFLPDLLGIPRLQVNATLTYTVPTTGGATRAIELVSASSACGSWLWSQYRASESYSYLMGRKPGPCTVKIRAANGFGRSATSSLTFW